MKIILIMGLPGAGKTTLANELAKLIESKRLNADEIRRAANDWDFSEEGRTRQAKRMSEAALKIKSEGNNVIADFICPTPEARKLFPADYIVWVDTIKEANSFAKVVLPAPGRPIIKIIFIIAVLKDDGTLVQVHFCQLNIVVQV